MVKVIIYIICVLWLGEVDGVDYYFESFMLIKDCYLLEWVEYDGYFYGFFYEGLEVGWVKYLVDVIVLDIVGVLIYYQVLGD